MEGKKEVSRKKRSKGTLSNTETLKLLTDVHSLSCFPVLLESREIIL